MIKKLFFLLLPVFAFSQHPSALKKGDFFFNKSVNDSAVFYYNAGIKNCENCSEILLAKYYLKFGKSNRLIGNNAIALKNYLKAEKIYERLENINGTFETKIYLAEFYRFIDNMEKSFQLIEEAEKIRKANMLDRKSLAFYYNRRAAIVSQQFDDKDKVIELSKKSIQIAKEVDAFRLMVYSYTEMAYAYEGQKNNVEARKYYFKAYEIAKEFGLGIEMCDVLYHIGEEEFRRIEYSQNSEENETPQRYENARNYFKEGLMLATKINYLEKQKDFSKRLFHNYYRTKQYKEAIKYNQQYNDYNNLILRNNKKKEIAEIEGNYLNEKKDAQIKVNEREIKIQYFVLFSFAVLLVLLLFFYVKSKKDKSNIQTQKNKIEEILAQKTMLLKEIHHRVKNNLQLISGLLYLQVVKHKNKEVSSMVEESQKHINSIALVHEMLYQEDSLSLISMEEYLAELSTRLLQVAHQNISCRLQVKAISLPIDYATTLGLICNELITNSLKYAFESHDGTVTVSLEEVAANEYTFTYADSGNGFDFNKKMNEGKTLGQKLIKMLAEEIGAKLTVKSEKGLKYIFNFNIKTE